MINMFKGNLVLMQGSNLFLENNSNLKKIYVCRPENYELNNEYKFYIYSYTTTLDKCFNVTVNFGFDNLQDAIHFEELIIINSNTISVTLALKIINEGYDQFVELIRINDIETIKSKYSLSKEALGILINYFNTKILNSFSPSEAEKMSKAFKELTALGFKEELVAMSIWKNKDKIIKNDFSKVFKLVINDIQKEQNEIE